MRLPGLEGHGADGSKKSPTPVSGGPGKNPSTDLTDLASWAWVSKVILTPAEGRVASTLQVSGSPG